MNVFWSKILHIFIPYSGKFKIREDGIFYLSAENDYKFPFSKYFINRNKNKPIPILNYLFNLFSFEAFHLSDDIHVCLH